MLWRQRLRMPVLRIVTLVLEALLGVITAYAAYTLFAWTPPNVTKARDALRFPRWYWVLAGVMATIGAIGLLVGLGFPMVGVVAALWMAAYFVVATFTHLIRRDLAMLGVPLLFLAICVGLVALQWADATPLLALIGM